MIILFENIISMVMNNRFDIGVLVLIFIRLYQYLYQIILLFVNISLNFTNLLYILDEKLSNPFQLIRQDIMDIFPNRRVHRRLQYSIIA